MPATGAVVTDEAAVGFFERHQAVFDQDQAAMRPMKEYEPWIDLVVGFDYEVDCVHGRAAILRLLPRPMAKTRLSARSCLPGRSNGLLRRISERSGRITILCACRPVMRWMAFHLTSVLIQTAPLCPGKMFSVALTDVSIFEIEGLLNLERKALQSRPLRKPRERRTPGLFTFQFMSVTASRCRRRV
jgi:hypothetical protein